MSREADLRVPRIAFGAVAVAAALALTGAGPDSRVSSLLRAEGVRISDALASLDRKPPSDVPAPRGRRGGDRCGGATTGVREVSNARELARALAEARPGDHLRMRDGVYRGSFEITRSGTASAPITLCGSREAILDNGRIDSGYGVHLAASHWRLVGFTVRNARKGIMADGASANVLEGLEVHDIGDEGVHFRRFSRDNVLRDSWVHDVGLDTPFFGEAVYIGSARSNWGEHSSGGPDACDSNQVLGNVLGPEVRAEGVDAKEGTRGGVIAGNVFLAHGATAADSWVDLKGNGYRVEDNAGTFDPRQPWRGPVCVFPSAGGWGEGNVVGESKVVPMGAHDPPGTPYRLGSPGRGAITLVLPRRHLPYGIVELAVCFPQAFEVVSPGVFLLHEHLLAGPGTRLEIPREDVRELRLRSAEGSFATVIGVRNEIAITGSEAGRVWIRSWDPARKGPDRESRDGRAFVTIVSGRMDVDRAECTDLGFGTGWASGAAWKGRPGEKARGDVSRSRFERNHFGAYSFEADSMRWTDNVFANNDIYGFDPHDNSDWFVVTGNQAFGNPRHGIIFSRGCRGNVVRHNASFSNHGHGIMFDDGKVLEDGNPRHAASVPPVANVIEGNEVWNNEVGIALQGCMDHVVRANRIRDNRFGIRLDASDRNAITENQILRSEEFALHLLGGSDSNRIVGNHIQGGQGGVVTLDSRHNTIQDNAISGIIGQGIKVAGPAGRTVLYRNRIGGRGSRAIDVREARSPAVLDSKQNATLGWMSPRESRPAMMLWGTILGVPMLSCLLRRLRRAPRRRHSLPLVGLVVLGALFAGPAAADGQRLSLTASFRAVHDDNVFKYSDPQLRDIRTGTTPFRYGIREPGDVVAGPGLALTWTQDMAGSRRRAIRLRADGALYRTNTVANFGELEATWRESFAGVRRLTLDYGYSPHHLLRKLYDADLTSLPSSERYRDARYDAQGGSIAWRNEVPFATWLEATYALDRRTYEPAFRERDSDFHTLRGALGWEAARDPSALEVSGGHLWRLARAEDGDPGLEGDLSYHGPELAVEGRVGLRSLAAGWLYGDAGYSIERRVHDATRPEDAANYHRKDLVQAVELGLGWKTSRAWGARAFYRFGWCRADLATNAPLDAELGSYDQRQIGIAVDWTSEVQRRPFSGGGGPTPIDR